MGWELDLCLRLFHCIRGMSADELGGFKLKVVVKLHRRMKEGVM